MLREATLEARRRRRPLRRYAYDLQAFIHDCFDWRDEKPTEYQDEIAAELVNQGRVAVHGPHGLGKTTTAALVILWGVLTTSDVKVPTTASAWRQLTKFLWPEVHKWAQRLRWDKLGRAPFSNAEMQVLSLKLSATQEAFALASNRADLIEGAHAERMVYVFDEAKAIPPDTWDAAEGAFASGEAFALAISTPGGQSGRFYDICAHRPGYEDWWVRHVTLQESINAGRISPEWAEQRRKQWGETSPVYIARVLGMFPPQSEDQLISLQWVDEARERVLEIDETQELIDGVDVARYGSADSVIIGRQGSCVLDAEIVHGNDTMQLAGRVRARGHRAHVDEIGVGAGVVDRLKELHHAVLGINVGGSPKDKEHFQVLRDELYWLLRERFREGDIDLSRMPRDVYDRLSGEITAMRYTYTSRGQIKIPPKDETVKELGFSPDVADALTLCFAPGTIRAKVRRLGG